MKNLTKRETILIVVLINLLLYYVLFNLIGEKIEAKNVEKKLSYEELLAQKEILKITELKSDVDIAKLKSIKEENDNMKDKIFSITNTENIHNFIYKLTQKNNLNISYINIVDKKEENGDILLYKGEKIEDKMYIVELSVEGSYENKIKFIKDIENLDKTILITEFSGLDMKKNTQSKLIINIYTMKKLKTNKEFEIN